MLLLEATDRPQLVAKECGKSTATSSANPDDSAVSGDQIVVVAWATIEKHGRGNGVTPTLARYAVADPDIFCYLVEALRRPPRPKGEREP
jgi:hypothetical protein